MNPALPEFFFLLFYSPYPYPHSHPYLQRILWASYPLNTNRECHLAALKSVDSTLISVILYMWTLLLGVIGESYPVFFPVLTCRACTKFGWNSSRRFRFMSEYTHTQKIIYIYWDYFAAFRQNWKVSIFIDNVSPMFTLAAGIEKHMNNFFTPTNRAEDKKNWQTHFKIINLKIINRKRRPTD